MTALVNQHGLPLRRDRLTEVIAGPMFGTLRSPVAGYPGDGLNPIRLAQILRSADYGDPTRYFELAEQIEERDPHYVGVLGTRKRSVAQVEVSVVAASEDASDVAMADMVREWLDRDELEDEKFDILDAIGKGDSFTEIIWDSSEGQWRPERLEWRDPRWFEYDRRDGRTPLLRGGDSGHGASTPLEPYKFIRHTVKAKSGLPVRSGIARIAAWGWMFKAFTLRDWSIFAQTYGQPVRLGRFDSNASAEDRATLWRAVANIAGDCAAIVPKGMDIEFKESSNVSAGSDLYERRANWLDRQISKAVLGQTTTTDAVSGGHAVAKEHRQVQEDIERADCKGLAATLNRDLIRPWIDLEYGPQKRYPRLRIERPEADDLQRLATVLNVLVPMGLRVSMAEVRDRIGLSDPAKGDEILTAPSAVSPPALFAPTTGAPTEPEDVALNAAKARQPSPADVITDRLASNTEDDMRDMLGTLSQMMQRASSMGELREMVLSAYPALDAEGLIEKLSGGLLAARAAGMSDVHG